MWQTWQSETPKRLYNICLFVACVIVCSESGCGNAVLRIYSNKSTMPTHELCGISDEEIVSAANSVRFKCVSNPLFKRFYSILNNRSSKVNRHT